MNKNDLREILIRLLHHTSPYPNEREVLSPILKELLPMGTWHKTGNFVVELGKSTTLFSCHLDTMDLQPTKLNFATSRSGELSLATNISNKNAICLGGDDRCGILILIAMIDAKVPGTYVFHIGEERGCIGSTYFRSEVMARSFDRAIDFDRKGTCDIITHMSGIRTCSDTFAEILANELGLGFKPDNSGLYTNTLEYADIIPEITNLSVGYHCAHSPKEFIDVSWLINKFIPAVINVDWENLPIVRNSYDDHYESDYMFDDYFECEVFNEKTYLTITNSGWCVCGTCLQEFNGCMTM